MKKLLVISLFLMTACNSGDGGKGGNNPEVLNESLDLVYKNDFNDVGSLDEFTIHTEEFDSYDPPPLSTVSLESGRLQIESDYYSPNGIGNPPYLNGRATLTLDMSLYFDRPFNTTLVNNLGLVSWSVDIANQDGDFNNGFIFVLASTLPDPYNLNAYGYYLHGGGMDSDRLRLSRFDLGIGGRQEVLIDVPNGLSTLPEQGSLKITYDPVSSEWALYGKFSMQFIDPSQINIWLGTAFDSTYTSIETRYFSLGGSGTGFDIFDNVLVVIDSEQ